MGHYRNSTYYDKVFQLDKYNCHYSNSWYYPMWKIIMDYIKVDDNILEIGCGTGQFAHMLLDNDVRKYTGIDFSKKGIMISREFIPLIAVSGFPRFPNFKFLLHDARKKCPIEYDTVICLQTLEHIDRDLLVLRNLKSGTKFIGSVPMGNDPAHVRIFKTLDSIVKRYGKLIEFEEIRKYDTKFIFKGIIK